MDLQWFSMCLFSIPCRENTLRNLNLNGQDNRGGQRTKSATSDDLNLSASEAGKDGKDAAYWERRRKNNEAAKRSRDNRRAKEAEVGMRAQYLENENNVLKVEIASLRTQVRDLEMRLRGQQHQSEESKSNILRINPFLQTQQGLLETVRPDLNRSGVSGSAVELNVSSVSDSGHHKSIDIEGDSSSDQASSPPKRLKIES